MITMVRSRMKSKAPVSLVTTTATNESSPELPNSELEPPPRRDRRMQTLPFHGSRVQATRIDSGDAARPRPLVEQLLDDVSIESVALFHAHVQQLQGILEAGQAARELFLSGPARPLVGRRDHEPASDSIAAPARSSPRLISSS